MRPWTFSTRPSWRALVVALTGLGALVLGGWVTYFGDGDPQEYRWKGPLSAVVIAMVCLAAVAALRLSALPGLIRSSGYAAVMALGTLLSLNASLSYYDAQCQDPAFEGSCGIPPLAAMGWATIVVLGVAAMVLVAEAPRRHQGRRLTE